MYWLIILIFLKNKYVNVKILFNKNKYTSILLPNQSKDILHYKEVKYLGNYAFRNYFAAMLLGRSLIFIASFSSRKLIFMGHILSCS